MSSSERSSQPPPPLGSERTATIIGGLGVGICAIAAALGGAFPSSASAQPWVNDTIAPLRTILSFVGLIVAGAAITLRPAWFATWLLAGIAGVAAGCGFPSTVHSISFASFVLGGVACFGA